MCKRGFKENYSRISSKELSQKITFCLNTLYLADGGLHCLAKIASAGWLKQLRLTVQDGSNSRLDTPQSRSVRRVVIVLAILTYSK